MKHRKQLLSASLLLVLTIGCAKEDRMRTAPRPGPSSASQPEQLLVITRNGSTPSVKGPAEYFTGTVHIDSPFQQAEPARVGGATVTFEPGARTAWHTHPLGQTLIATAGVGWVQAEGGPVEEIRTGDIVWIPPNVCHWHGAAPTTGVTHIAIAEKLDGKSVDWMEQVTDAQYRKAPPPGAKP
jgi:4-carboxymuconolactone decarboxylase